MRIQKLAIALVAGSAIMVTSGAAQDTYTADTAHAHVGFQVPHMVISNVKGAFDDFSASLVLKEGKLEAVEATIQVASINTKNEKRDEHLRADDFFAVKEFPTITFVSTGVKGKKDGTGLISGKLTIRGVTKAVNLNYRVKGPVNDPWGNTKLGLEATTMIDRTAFGLTYSKALETGGLVVGNDVSIDIDLEFVKNKAE